VSEIEVEIVNADGLHMRPAMQFVKVATKFESEITVTNGDTSVDAKSIMQMITLAAMAGTHLTIKADGPDSTKATDQLRILVEEKMFDEPKAEADKKSES
jgi:phosphotransferase system HPr (HPr) family protein